MPTPDEIRAAQRAMWGKFSSGWEKWDAVILAMVGGVGDEMIDALEIADDEQHLEVAAGTGEPGLSIATRAPKGHVTLTDLAPEMLAVSERRARALGLTNVSYQEAGAESLPFADATFDSAAVRFGLMFVPDIAKAVSELARVVKPGGRVCAAVWAEPGRNEWATIPMAAIAPEVEMPPPDSDAPGMFRCAAPDAISALFRTAGLHDVREWDVTGAMAAETPDLYWTLIKDLTAPVGAALAQVDDAARARITARVIEGAQRHSDGKGGVQIPAAARCIIGTK